MPLKNVASLLVSCFASSIHLCKFSAVKTATGAVGVFSNAAITDAKSSLLTTPSPFTSVLGIVPSGGVVPIVAATNTRSSTSTTPSALTSSET